MPDDSPYTFCTSRVSGQADVEIHLATDRAEPMAYVRMPQIRGFHLLAEGRPAEELPRMAARISGLCPLHHQVGATMAVEDALGVHIPPAAQKLRHLSLLLAHISDKILHFFILSAPDIYPGTAEEEVLFLLLSGPHPSSVIREAMDMRQRVGIMLAKLTGRPFGGDVALVGGMSRSLSHADHHILQEEMALLRRFCLRQATTAQEEIVRPLARAYHRLDNLPLPSLGCVDSQGALELLPDADSLLRLVRPDGSAFTFPPREYGQHIVEEYADWTQAAFCRLREAPPLCLDPAQTEGLYRVGPLARLHACSHLSTPLAQQALEDFRQEYGPLPQHSTLYHGARLIELLHAAEKAQELLNDPDITSTTVLSPYRPGPAPEGLRRGFSHVEAPRGALFYHLSVDAQACITACHILSPTAQNNGAMNVSLTVALRALLREQMSETGPAGESGGLSRHLLRRLATCLRAYDPCPSCATHALGGPAGLTFSLHKHSGGQ